LNESAVIQSLKEGDEKAFEELVKAFGDRIYNTALGFVQNEHDAEEVTQDVFVKVHQNISGFKGESKLGTWLYRITVTQSIDFLRKKKRQKRVSFLTSIFGKQEVGEPDFHHPGVAAEQKENASVLFFAIRQLPELQQTAFLLQKMEGLSQQEVAEVMNTTESSVESLLHRAKTNLRKLLGDYYQKHFK
jgi:RNA polymerase sigma-70 factor (ECF subfamily)